MTQTYGTRHWPTEIRYHKAERELEVAYESGESFRLPAELLRVQSPSAEVQGHSPDQRQLVAGRKEVGIIGIEQVGNYAVRLSFDDLHDTGIYTWDYLYDLGANQERVWAEYLAELDQAGLSREPGSKGATPVKSGGCGGGGGKSGGSCGCG